MAASLITVISGPYTGTWDAFPLGTLSDDGYTLACTFQGQEVNESDAFGMTLVEAINRGQNWRCRIRGLEWQKTGLMASLQAYQTKTPTGIGLNPALGAIGDKLSSYTQALVLTAILGNPPTTPQTLTASSSIIAPQSVSDFNMTSKVREMPIEYILIPYSAGSPAANVPFTSA